MPVPCFPAQIAKPTVADSNQARNVGARMARSRCRYFIIAIAARRRLRRAGHAGRGGLAKSKRSRQARQRSALWSVREIAAHPERLRARQIPATAGLDWRRPVVSETRQTGSSQPGSDRMKGGEVSHGGLVHATVILAKRGRSRAWRAVALAGVA